MLNRIEAERVRFNLSREELAKKLNISVRTYYNWINEETDIPGIKLVIMARMFGTDVDYLLEGISGVPDNIECLRKRKWGENMSEKEKNLYEEERELLHKQLELLAEQSLGSLLPLERAEYSKQMVAIYSVLYP